MGLKIKRHSIPVLIRRSGEASHAQYPSQLRHERPGNATPDDVYLGKMDLIQTRARIQLLQKIPERETHAETWNDSMP